MENITRRKFCGIAIMTLPLLCLPAKATEGLSGQSDPILDALADEITRVAADGSQNGFTAEHFRRCAGIVRTFDARLEEMGTNRELDSRLEDNDFYELNPYLTAQKTVDYWDKHGMRLDKNDLTAHLTMDSRVYCEIKKSIKKQGGVRNMHARIADMLEQKANEHEAVVFRKRAVIKNSRVVFPSSNAPQAGFTRVQYELLPWFGNIDCLCKVMVVEGAALALMCATFCQPCCVPAMVLLGLEKVLEIMGACNPNNC